MFYGCKYLITLALSRNKYKFRNHEGVAVFVFPLRNLKQSLSEQHKTWLLQKHVSRVLHKAWYIQYLGTLPLKVCCPSNGIKTASCISFQTVRFALVMSGSMACVEVLLCPLNLKVTTWTTGNTRLCQLICIRLTSQCGAFCHTPVTLTLLNNLGNLGLPYESEGSYLQSWANVWAKQTRFIGVLP